MEREMVKKTEGLGIDEFMHIPKTVDKLGIGEKACIRRINTEDMRLLRRLIDMGLTPGTEVRFIKYAPLGDPMELYLRGYSLSIRKSDAAVIELMDAEEILRNANSYVQSRDEHSDGRINVGCGNYQRNCVRTVFNTETSNERASKTIEHGNIRLNHTKNKNIHLALVGNPNCGKTTLFNAITGEREYVGNWAGVTVEKKEGRVRALAKSKANSANAQGANVDSALENEMSLVDLPGIYSLSPFGMEEMIARRFIIEEKPDAIINIVDAGNLERNLYLTVQLMELGFPMVIALNMMDEVLKRGDSIDHGALSRELGIPVVPISARTGMGIDELILKINSVLKSHESERFFKPSAFQRLNLDARLYDSHTRSMQQRISDMIGGYAERANLPVHWVSIKLIEGDEHVMEALKLPSELMRRIKYVLEEQTGIYKNSFMDGASMLADSRYRYISKVTEKIYRRRHGGEKTGVSDKIDRILTNKYLALPIFVLIMAAVFTLTFGTLGAWLKGLMEQLIFDIIIPNTALAFTMTNVSEWLIGIVCDGVLAGVGGVMTFLPEIAILFLLLSILEDSGYMSRIAFIMDGAMRKFGLSGRSFIPLLMGFGCTVPAVMAARTMENMRDKRSTILLIPFMSCSAKLPVYALIAGAFFKENKMIVVLSLYLLGIMLAAIFGMCFKKTIFKSNDAAFMLELPPYRLPKVSDTLMHVFERVKHFLVKAGTLIFIMSIIIWLLMNFSFDFAPVGNNIEESILGKLGSAIAVIFKPLGFGSWMAVAALLTGLVAKESIVSTLSVLVGTTLTTGTASAALMNVFTPLSAYSFLVFVSLYTPCIAAVATIRRELGSGRYMLFAILFQIAVAYLAAFFVYTIGGTISML